MPALLNPHLFILPVTITYLNKMEYSSGTQMNASFDIGAADPGKEIFVIMSVTYSTVRTLAASTVAGVTVTKFTTDFASTDARQVGCFVSLPTQAGSQTIDMNFSGALGSGVAFVYKVFNRSNPAAQHTDTDGASGTGTSTTLSATTIPDGGFWLATGIKNNTNAVSWNNGTVDDEENNLLSNRAWCAHRDQQAAGSTPNDIVSWTGSNLHSGASWAFAG